jgi:hypothetical protein
MDREVVIGIVVVVLLVLVFFGAAIHFWGIIGGTIVLLVTGALIAYGVSRAAEEDYARRHR